MDSEFFAVFSNDNTVGDDEEINPVSNSTVVPAGESVSIAFYNVYGYNPTDGAALESDSRAFMSVFDQPFAGSILSRGMPIGTNVLNWGIVADATPASAAPVIANGYRADSLGNVYFAPGSSKLSKAAEKKLKAVVAANPSAIYKVTGYVQKSSTNKNNAELSLARAKAVETYLVSLGADVTFTVVLDAGEVPAKAGESYKARRATLFAMTPVVQ
jgi:outer membrane protein OmpA-like peptidoglycan-associated protein